MPFDINDYDSLIAIVGDEKIEAGNGVIAKTYTTPDNLATHTLLSGRIPTQDENDALVGTDGAPSSTNKYVTNSDSRNTNSRQCNNSFDNAATAKTNLSLSSSDVGLGNVADVDQQNASNLTSGTVSTARLPTGIDAANLADGSVSNAELQYINSVTSNVQDQLNAKTLRAVQGTSSQTTVNTGTPTIIATCTITLRDSANKVFLVGTGDGNSNSSEGVWHQVQLYRGSTAIGKFIYYVSAGATSTNIPFALTHLDSPATTGSVTYYIKANQGFGSFTYGESGDGQAPSLVAIEMETT